MVKVAIVGPESTGKSELAKQLADHYKTEWVQEMARPYLEKQSRPYQMQDVEKIARLQLEEEDRQVKSAGSILICDTTLLVIKIWMQNSFNDCPGWIIDSVQSRPYDIFLLTDIDLTWEPDPLREHPNQRQFFKDWYIEELNQLGANWRLISGIGFARFQNAIQAIEINFPTLKC